MIQQSIILADETIVSGHGAVNELTDELWMFVDKEEPFIRVATLFSDPEKTVVIKVKRTIETYSTYEGYAKLKTININRDGTYSVCLTK